MKCVVVSIIWVVFCVSILARPSPPGYNINLAHPDSVALNGNITNLIPPYWTCPNGTEYILLPVANQPTADPNTYNAQSFMATFRIMGCCQPNSTACMTDKNSMIQGCCPKGKVCCFNKLGIKIGCADSINQCCNNAICPTGWGCCNYRPLLIPQQATEPPLPTPPPQVRTSNYIGTFQCCPLPPMADINNKTTFCQINTTTNASMGCQVAYSQTFNYCQYAQYANFTDWPNQPGNAFLVQTPVPCSYDGTQNATRMCSNMTIKCPNSNQCAYVSSVQPQGVINATTNATDYHLLNSSIVVGCCPTSYTLCHGLNDRDVNVYGGCANPAIGETCCGTQICPNGTQCCTRQITVKRADPGTGNFVNTNLTIALGCCPTGLSCCTQSLRTSGRQNAYRDPFYCGATYNNQTCQLDKWREPFWYNLIQTQNNGLIPGIVP